ncbi:MAG TPA: hypothetical protein VFM74_04565 [Candidatus Limnocylindria bacterium]|nr:hypothetical protein [Candidatus Limnocylindria bacterium]
MRAFILSGSADIGGLSIGYKRAADKHPDIGLSIRSAVQSLNYIKYPYDVLMPGNGGAVQRLYDAADVIHVNQYHHTWRKLDRGQHKPVLMQHHGSLYRNAPEMHVAIVNRYGFELAVSTIDLLQPLPERTHWLPAAYDLDMLRSIRTKHRRQPDGVVRIAHSPTDRAIKSTDALVTAVTALQEKGVAVELDLIEHVSWAECLKRKAAADLFFDQVKLGYGCNSIESWGMGIPVIAGAQPWTLNRMKEEFGVLPFYRATEKTIEEAISAMVESADLREEYAERGQQHVERFHAEIPVLERLKELYQLAIDRRKPKARRKSDTAEAAA